MARFKVENKRRKFRQYFADLKETTEPLNPSPPSLP